MKPDTPRAGPLARLFAHYASYHEHGQLQRYMALMGIIAFPALYLMRFVRSAPGYDDFALRALDTLLCVVLLLRSHWPERLKPWYMGYSYAVLVITLPLTFVFTSLMNGGGPAAVGNTFFAVFMLMLLADWRNLIAMLVGGFSLATGLYFAISPNPAIPMEYVARLPVLLVGVIGGSLFKHALERASGERVRQAYASLAGSIAHEMRNPLAQVRHSLEQIREALPMPSLRLQDQVIDAGSVERLYRHVSQGETAVRRGLQVIDMTLDEVNARAVDATRLVHVGAADLCTKAVEEFGYEDAAQRARVRVEVRRDFVFRGDETAFLFVLFNLLKNALHYLPVQPDMTVRIEVDAGRICVCDTGPGIPPDILPDLFQPFRTSGKSSGTGLGLAYCQRVIRALGGEISCQSVPGGTTEFMITLPMIAGNDVTAGRDQTLAQARRVLADKRVLVVDDDAALRVSTRQHLLSLCCTVREAGDGLEALQALRETPFDLVLLDLNMPRMDGYEVAESVRRGLAPLNTEVCLVAHTAEPAHLARVKTHKAGFDGFVTKPADPLLFMQALQAALAQRTQAVRRPAGWLRGRRILVADDNAYNRMALAAYLRHAGAQVVEAADGQAALERLALAPDIDAVLLDMEMPRLGGLETARAIRAGAAGERHIPILAVTGYAGAEVLAACGAAGIAACIVKPVDQATLYEKLGEALGVRSEATAAAPVAQADLLDEDRLANFLRLGMLHELVGEFVPQINVLVERIHQAHAAGDQRGALDALHSLVGMSGEAGASALYAYGRDTYVGMRESGLWPTQPLWTGRLRELTDASNQALVQWAAGHGERAIG
jgi:CheY-like chemotaxis protein